MDKKILFFGYSLVMIVAMFGDVRASARCRSLQRHQDSMNRLPFGTSPEEYAVTISVDGSNGESSIVDVEPGAQHCDCCRELAEIKEHTFRLQHSSSTTKVCRKMLTIYGMTLAAILTSNVLGGIMGHSNDKCIDPTVRKQ